MQAQVLDYRGALCSDNTSSAMYETSVTAGGRCLVQLKDHSSCGNEFSPKVRKPYTMTKQRERWKEEEHEKFLEALKLFGRDWRQIEEHVGTKTAVQIRSHAQKFFSKVTRSNGCRTALGHIEIPPPRPKRKPLHPYPRKVVNNLHKVPSIEEQTRSLSPQLSVSENECLSLSSIVVAASDSDAKNSAKSSIPHDTASPDSSVPFVASELCSEPNSSSLETESPTPVLETTNSKSHEKVSKNLELFPKDVNEEDVFTQEVSTQSLKLFGRTVLVADPNKRIQTVEDCGDHKQVNRNQTSMRNSMVMESSTGNEECTWINGTFYFIQLNNGNSNQGAGSAAPMSWWSSHGDFPFSFVRSFKQADSDLNVEVNDKESNKDQSCCGSNTGSVSVSENNDKCAEIDVQSHRDSVSKDELIGKSLFPELRTSHEKYTKGFVPYKRCMSKRDSQSCSMTGAEGEEKRIRLCL